jgi:rhodanese-related sulfurtransferase
MTKEISRATVAEAILAENPPIVLEALPRRHYEAGHIPGARALPLDEVAKTLGAPRRSKWKRMTVESGFAALHSVAIAAWRAVEWSRRTCSRSGLV